MNFVKTIRAMIGLCLKMAEKLTDGDLICYFMYHMTKKITLWLLIFSVVQTGARVFIGFSIK